MVPGMESGSITYKPIARLGAASLLVILSVLFTSCIGPMKSITTADPTSTEPVVSEEIVNIIEQVYIYEDFFWGNITPLSSGFAEIYHDPNTDSILFGRYEWINEEKSFIKSCRISQDPYGEWHCDSSGFLHEKTEYEYLGDAYLDLERRLPEVPELSSNEIIDAILAFARRGLDEMGIYQEATVYIGYYYEYTEAYAYATFAVLVDEMRYWGKCEINLTDQGYEAKSFYTTGGKLLYSDIWREDIGRFIDNILALDRYHTTI